MSDVTCRFTAGRVIHKDKRNDNESNTQDFVTPRILYSVFEGKCDLELNCFDLFWRYYNVLFACDSRKKKAVSWRNRRRVMDGDSKIIRVGQIVI